MVADTNPIANALQRIIATANEMLDVDIQVEKVLQVGRENPLPREKAAQLIHKIIERIRDGATERDDRTTTAQLEGDLPAFVQEIMQAGHRDGGTHSGGHIVVSPAQYWRVRMNYGRYEQLSREAWDRGEVGVWYGGWSAQDFITAQAQQDALTYQQHNTPHSLLVFTLANDQRVLQDRLYAEAVADRLLEFLFDIDSYRGTGRLYLP